MLLGWVVSSAQLYCLCSEPNLSIHTSLSSHQLAWLCWRKHSYYMMMPPLIGWCVQGIIGHIYTKSIHLWNWLKTYPSQYGGTVQDYGCNVSKCGAAQDTCIPFEVMSIFSTILVSWKSLCALSWGFLNQADTIFAPSHFHPYIIL